MGSVHRRARRGRWETARLLLAAGVVAALGLACRSANPPRDLPLPPGAALAEVTLAIDLPVAAGCESDFDLALYEDRAVHRIVWDERTGACLGRTVTIAFLSDELSADDVVERARAHAVRAEIEAP